ncbi:MAG: tRNA threonylcarbamoyladenosine dehydratase [Clostridia bacterium]|nr:tRNA threonylcarbamoyladenosine dehydratase [Clostridia bacterium]
MDRFLRTKALIGQEAFDRLQNAHIVVVGAGGVGGAALEGLARAGIGRITVIDPDVFSVSNCNRQILALSSTVGRSKAEVAGERCHAINPQLKITALSEKIAAENIDTLMSIDVDFIADCIDDAPAKEAIAAFCKEHKIPLLMCMGTGNRLSSEGMRIVNFEKTENCPLAKKMRLALRKSGFRRVRCLYSMAPAVSVAPIDEAGKRTVGSISFVPPVAGYRMAEHILLRLIEEKTEEDIPE